MHCPLEDKGVQVIGLLTREPPVISAMMIVNLKT